jgi:hypothetical protein
MMFDGVARNCTAGGHAELTVDGVQVRVNGTRTNNELFSVKASAAQSFHLSIDSDGVTTRFASEPFSVPMIKTRIESL